MAAVLREGMSALMGRETPLDVEDRSIDAVAGYLAFDPAIVAPDGLGSYDPERPIPCSVHMLRSDPDAAPMFAGTFPPEAVEPFLTTHPDATCELVEGATHFISAEEPDRFTASLTDFLWRVR